MEAVISCERRKKTRVNITAVVLQTLGRTGHHSSTQMNEKRTRVREMIKVRVRITNLHDGVVGNVVLTTLALLLLKLEGDTADRALLDTTHKVGNISSNLVSKTLGGDDGNITADLLVDVEVKGQLGVVLLDNDASSLLDGLGSNAALLFQKKHRLTFRSFVLFFFWVLFFDKSTSEINYQITITDGTRNKVWSAWST
jgi:hypothetical protein